MKAEREPTGKLQTVGASVFQPLKLRVFHEGDTVVFEIDGTQLKMDYDSALTVATHLKLHGRQAKKWAGDYRKVWSTEGSLLTDAEENYKRGWS